MDKNIKIYDNEEWSSMHKWIILLFVFNINRDQPKQQERRKKNHLYRIKKKGNGQNLNVDKQ